MTSFINQSSKIPKLQEDFLNLSIIESVPEEARQYIIENLIPNKSRTREEYLRELTPLSQTSKTLYNSILSRLDIPEKKTNELYKETFYIRGEETNLPYCENITLTTTNECYNPDILFLEKKYKPNLSWEITYDLLTFNSNEDIRDLNIEELNTIYWPCSCLVVEFPIAFPYNERNLPYKKDKYPLVQSKVFQNKNGIFTQKDILQLTTNFYNSYFDKKEGEILLKTLYDIYRQIYKSIPIDTEEDANEFKIFIENSFLENSPPNLWNDNFIKDLIQGKIIKGTSLYNLTISSFIPKETINGSWYLQASLY